MNTVNIVATVAPIVNLTLYSGVAATLEVSLFTPSDVAQPIGSNLLRWEVRTKGGSIVLTKTSAVGGGIEITDAQNGKCRVKIDEKDLPQGVYKHRFFVIDELPDPHLAFHGDLSLV